MFSSGSVPLPAKRGDHSTAPADVWRRRIPRTLGASGSVGHSGGSDDRISVAARHGGGRSDRGRYRVPSTRRTGPRLRRTGLVLDRTPPGRTRCVRGSRARVRACAHTRASPRDHPIGGCDPQRTLHRGTISSRYRGSALRNASTAGAHWPVGPLAGSVTPPPVFAGSGTRGAGRVGVLEGHFRIDPVRPSGRPANPPAAARLAVPAAWIRSPVHSNRSRSVLSR
jgi:hypothetical protein